MAADFQLNSVTLNFSNGVTANVNRTDNGVSTSVTTTSAYLSHADYVAVGVLFLQLAEAIQPPQPPKPAPTPAPTPTPKP
jgi:hypothetical protein